MKIDEAIEILNDIIHYVEPDDPPDEHDAIKLGIEALIFTRNVLKLMPVVFPLPLPGETEE